MYFDCDMKKEVSNLYNSGIPGYKISEKLGISHGTVYRFLRNEGIVKSISEARREYSLNENYMDNIDTQEKAYILGLYMADGCNFTPRNDLILSINKKDTDLVERVRKEFSSNAPLHIDRERLVTLHLSSKHLSKTMESHGVVRAKSNILEFPKLKSELMSHFMRGYLDGDGCIYINNKDIRLSCVSFTSSTRFINGLKEYLENEYKINSCITNRHVENMENATLHISGLKKICVLLNILYNNSNIQLSRKYDKYTYILNKRPKYNGLIKYKGD